MGDKDGARELLKEVVKEGDTAQQQRAQSMLQTLGAA
jgi:FimV-like protein